jgi:hypothetical protein
MAILANQKVLTLDYWKPASKIQVGDYVFDKNGKPVQVKLVQEYYSDECFEVKFDDHITVGGDKNLSFPSENPKYRKRTHEYKGRRPFLRPLRSVSVEQALETGLKTKHNRLSYSVPTTKPLELPHQTLPVPPFIFGFWFFNHKSSGVMRAPPGQHDKIAQKFKDHGYQIEFVSKSKLTFRVKPTIESQLAPYIPTKIPQNYLLASPEQRLELLSGIIHAKSRQYDQKLDRFRFSSLHYPTVLLIQGLIESLGCRSRIHHDQYRKTYTVYFRIKLKIFDNQNSPPVKVHQARRYISKISKIAPQMCVHIETESNYLVGEGFISCL